MKQFLLRKELFGRTITAQANLLDSGIHVLLAGGDISHVGTVSMADGGKLLYSCAFPTRREQVVSDEWAVRISVERRCAVTVACGIHYENAARQQIQAILDVTDALLQEILKKLEEKRE